MLEYKCFDGSTIEYDGIKVMPYAQGLLTAVMAYRNCGEYAEEECFTVNINGGIDIGNESVPGMFLAYLDTNNCPSVESFFKKHKLGKPYKRFGMPVYGASGFCEFPLYELDADALKGFDPKGCKIYEANYERNFEKARKQLLSGKY